MKVQACCEEKDLRSLYKVFGYAESEKQCCQAEKMAPSPSNFHIYKMAAKQREKKNLFSRNITTDWTESTYSEVIFHLLVFRR